MIAVRPKIKTNLNFTHYGLKFLIGGGTKDPDVFGRIETDESDMQEPEQAATRPGKSLEEVKR